MCNIKLLEHNIKLASHTYSTIRQKHTSSLKSLHDMNDHVKFCFALTNDSFVWSISKIACIWQSFKSYKLVMNYQLKIQVEQGLQLKHSDHLELQNCSK